MALVRCEEHVESLLERSEGYAATIHPIGYPETAAVCGRDECDRVGAICLKDDEYKEYLNGKRTSNPHTNAVYIRAKDPVVTEL